MASTRVHLWRTNEVAGFPSDKPAIRVDKKADQTYRVALLIPMCGAAGMWAPSCIASAEVALNELNAQSGICGRPVELVLINAAIEAETPAETVIEELIAQRQIDAIVGMHISAVRQQIIATVQGRIPFIYTPLYEGGEAAPGVFAIGDTPARQLGPAIRYMSDRFRLKKWALIGNDYIWPRVSHAHAKKELHRQHLDLVAETYLPFSSNKIGDAVDALGMSGADAVLISLVGQDAVVFNRIFGGMKLHDRIFRLSCAIEENGLLASGARNLDRLFSSASYFARLETAENAEFRAKYHSLHQERAPMLNALGQSTYEGLHFLASLVSQPDQDWRLRRVREFQPIVYKSARRGFYTTNASNASPVFVARANGFVFDDLRRLP
ncbi:substrate-binding domain-containing protein [uncultured Roseobacter sp.]|uniref:substrate-binding domain-containing protein n=1 Tax=uncultured Roseobacter sp. TaxID=114847 RepID=UPI0026250FF5|nr:substrate-binding domain-containing protein [uncultured Roseobacter sp.]